MFPDCDRRRFLGAGALGVLGAAVWPLGPVRGAPARLELGEEQPFDYEKLVERARERAQRAYRPPERPAPEVVDKIDYETHGKIRFRPELALHASGPSVYPATFFHLGRYFPKKVAMFALRDGAAQEIRYSPDYFTIPRDSIARRLPPESGFAGFRLHEARRRDDWQTNDWVAFLGASYFRAIGALGQYGLSARGIAVDTAVSGAEEFPDFVEFYIGAAASDSDPVPLYALLDGPSIAGAYRFGLRRKDGVVMEVEVRLFLRRDVERLGIAPLTSMFWYSEQNRGSAHDWRPEVHDSDGLAIWNGRGERLWRPLNNSPEPVVSSFLDEGPRGFGLLQRDRNFEHFLDGVRYDRRPSLWVEPLDDWGSGRVQLVELPTNDEIHDNIVAFWLPEKPATAGTAYRFRYRLHWLADEPFPAERFGRCVATRRGRGGEPGKPRPRGVEKFVVEFAGGLLERLQSEAPLKAEIDASRGEISYLFVEPVPGTRRWRLQFDLEAEGVAPVELRAHLVLGDRTLTETWLFQYHPGASA